MTKTERHRLEVVAPDTAALQADARNHEWRQRLPVLSGTHVVLRELQAADAPALHALFAAAEVSRFISSPPDTLDACSRLIARAREQRAAGTAVWFAVTLPASDTAVGVFHVRATEPSFGTGEWEFAVGSPFWGSETFRESAALIVEFAFAALGVHRLEARVAARNGRGIGALRKLGAVEEGLLRKSLLRGGEYLDQVLYTIVDVDWRVGQRMPKRASLRVH